MKRYVLLLADRVLAKDDLAELLEAVQKLTGRAAVIALKENPKAVVVKTSGPGARSLRLAGADLRVRGATLKSVSTSGAIGKLKSRAAASGTAEDGEVPE